MLNCSISLKVLGACSIAMLKQGIEKSNLLGRMKAIGLVPDRGTSTSSSKLDEDCYSFRSSI